MLSGLLVPLVTPVAAGTVREADVAALIGALGPYADGLVPAVSTGEGWALDDRQWRDMVAHTVRHAGGRPVLAGILRPTTAEVLALAGTAAALGAAAIVTTTPYGPVSQEEMYAHYAALAAGPLPVVVYHESAVSRNTLDRDTLLAVCQLPGIAAVKDSAGGTERLRAAGVTVWQGREQLTGSIVDGLVLAAAQVAPELCARLSWAPTPELAAQLVEVCNEHDLFADDRYRGLKTWLRDRGVISTAATVADR